MIIEKCSQIEFDLCIWTYLGRRGTDVICVSAEMRFCLNHYLVKNVSFLRSLPARGVWIEIWRERPGRLWGYGSLPARGVWIEIICRYRWRLVALRHSPQGECGLKLVQAVAPLVYGRHSPQGECGLKSSHALESLVEFGHSPQGECGLKFHLYSSTVSQPMVTPRKGSVD